MSIEPHPTGKPLTPAVPPNWGELAPDGQAAVIIRFIVEQGTISIPAAQFKRWEHTLGLPETLTLVTGSERIIVEGKELAPVCAALDLGRLCELRVNYPSKSGSRPGPLVRRIAVEPA